MSFSITACDPFTLDLMVFLLWTRGLSQAQLVARREVDYASASTAERRETLELLTRDTADQFRVFGVLEPLLRAPRLLGNQVVLQLPPSTRRFAVEVYYTFDDLVIRELLGRKLSTKARKDLDDVSESAGVPLLSCRRQFDCLKRIYNAMDDRGFQGSVALLVETLFCLSSQLSRRFANIIFLLYNRFTLQASRKKTSFLALADLEYCAGVITSLWVREVGASGGGASGGGAIGGGAIGSGGGDGISVGNSGIGVGGGSGGGSMLGRGVAAPSAHLGAAGASGSGAGAAGAAATSSAGSHQHYASPHHRSTSSGHLAFTPPGGTAAGEAPYNEPGLGSAAMAAPGSTPEGRDLGAKLRDAAEVEDSGMGMGMGLAWSAGDVELAGSPAILPGIAQLSSRRNVDHASCSLDIDPLLVSRLRDLRTVLVSNRGLLDEYLKHVGACLALSIGAVKLKKFGPRLRGWLKQVLSVGAGLGQPKELRDLFEDLVCLTEQIVNLRLGRAEVRSLFDALTQSISKIEHVRRQQLDRDWIQFLEGIRSCILRIHPEKSASTV